MGINQQELDKWSARFGNHSLKTVAIGRLIPGVRSFIAIPAVLQKMSLMNFALANLLGATFWISLLSVGGYFLGENYKRYSSYLTYGSIVLILGRIAYAAVKRKVNDTARFHIVYQ